MGLVRPALVAAGRALLEHPRVRELYPDYLVATHGIVRASVPLMEMALGRARSIAGVDAVAAGVVPYLEEHIPEEMHHDEWLLEDLEVLGFERSDVVSRPPSPTVAELVGAQYYWILHYHPVALLGYMALLEGYPPVRADIEGLIGRTGYERSAFRTLLHHAELDPGHGNELFGVIGRLPLTEGQSAVVGVSALSSARLLTEVILEVVQRVGDVR